MMSVDLKSDIFVIPALSENSIIYSPLRGCAFYANSEATKIVKEFIESGNLPKKDMGVGKYLYELSKIEVEEPQKVDLNVHCSDAMFILSQMCNMACSYCYAQEARAKEVLSIEKIKTVVDFVCSNNNCKTKTFMFIGGGEPLITWDVFEWSVNYIKRKTEEKGFFKKIKLTTNGTLLNEKRIAFLKENNITPGISFDILAEVQDEQRPFPDRKMSSFECVHKNMKSLISNGLIPRIRSTITSRNVELMPQMVEFVAREYPKVKFLHFEPVTDINDNNEKFYNIYITAFMKALHIAKENDIYLANSIIRSLNRIRRRFCCGEFCITPSSDIVSCHRISSSKDAYFDAFRYGMVTDKIEIKRELSTSTLKLFEKKSEHCLTCFAKWHCSGGCPMYRVTSTEKGMLAYCNFVKNMLASALGEMLNKASLS